MKRQGSRDASNFLEAQIMLTRSTNGHGKSRAAHFTHVQIKSCCLRLTAKPREPWSHEAEPIRLRRGVPPPFSLRTSQSQIERTCGGSQGGAKLLGPTTTAVTISSVLHSVSFWSKKSALRHFLVEEFAADQHSHVRITRAQGRHQRAADPST